MSSQFKLFASLDSLTDLDGDDCNHGDGSSSQSADRAVSVPATPNSANANHLLLVALLEYVCSLHVTNRRKRDKLFKVLCTQLAQMNIMSPLVAVDELSSVRTQYQQYFATLLHSSVNNLKLDSQRALPDPNVLHRKSFYQNRLPLLHQPSMGLSNMIGFHTSRYSNEYEELESLGKGAYGSVHKVRHKLDGSFYAVKKVAFQDDRPEIWNKTLREVKHLADLNHTSVIRYYTAWLEYQLPNFLNTHGKQEAKTRDDFDLPALTYHHDQPGDSSNSRSGPEECCDPSAGSSVVFDDSPPVRPPRKYHRTNSWELSGPDGTRSDWCTRLADRAELSMASGDNGLLLGQSYVALYIQMELCCETLQDWLQTRNSTLISSKEVYHAVEETTNLYIMKEVLLGVNYLHRQNLIHRDLKPSNIFLNHRAENKMEVKIGDFGLARQTHSSPDGGADGMPPTPPMTPAPGVHQEHVLDMNGLILTTGVGTTIYASPEQLAGMHYGAKSDMYSFGLIKYELYQPFCTLMERSKTLQDVRKGCLPCAFSEKWPLESEMIHQLIDLDPDQRPSAEEMLEGRLFNTEQQVIQLLQKSLHDKDRELLSKRQEIEQKDSRIRRLEHELADKNKELEKLRALLCPLPNGNS